MSTPVVPAVPHVSWLKKLGHVISNVLKIIAKDAQPVEQIAKPVAEALLPQFIPLIEAADSIFSKIVKQVSVAEVMAAAVGAAPSGPAKLQAVLASFPAELDQWIANNFPGAQQLSEVEKSNLVNAIVAILNKVNGGAPVA